MNRYDYTKLQQNNTTGIRGVVWHKKDKRWMVQIKVHNENIYIGYYSSKQEAKQVRKALEKLLNMMIKKGLLV